jgi:hypothetical protein
MPRLPVQYHDGEFRGWLLRYTESVIRHVALHFATAAERGIEQAANLLCDPTFYETRKKRRQNWKKSMEEQQAKQQWEKMERQLCPTAEQIAHDTTWCEKQLKYHEAQITIYKDNLARLRALDPNQSVRIPSKSVQ